MWLKSVAFGAEAVHEDFAIWLASQALFARFKEEGAAFLPRYEAFLAMTGSATCETYDTCEAGAKVTLCTLAGMGHCWPGQPVCPYGAANTDLSADDALWSFFSQFTLP